MGGAAQGGKERVEGDGTIDGRAMEFSSHLNFLLSAHSAAFDVNFCEAGTGMTALHWAVQVESTGVVRSLLERYAFTGKKRMNQMITTMDVNCQDKGGRTPLHLACIMPPERAVRTGGLGNTSGGGGSGSGSGNSNSSESAAEKEREVQASLLIADDLLHYGADPTIRTETTQDTPLHYAIYGGHIAVVRLLLDSDSGTSCMEIRNRDGMTALHTAVRKRE
jgi:ankyrin repeat protein